MDGQYPNSIEESVNGAEPAPQLNPDDFRETPEYSGEETQQPQQPQSDQYKDQYTQQPFAQPTNPLPPGYMPNTPAQPHTGLPEHTSLGSLATALAVHKGYLQPK